MKNLKLVSRETKKATVVKVSDVKFGRDFVVIAGPCSVENEKQILDTDQALTPDMFANIMKRLGPLKSFINNLPMEPAAKKNLAIVRQK